MWIITAPGIMLICFYVLLVLDVARNCFCVGIYFARCKLVEFIQWGSFCKIIYSGRRVEVLYYELVIFRIALLYLYFLSFFWC